MKKDIKILEELKRHIGGVCTHSKKGYIILPYTDFKNTPKYLGVLTNAIKSMEENPVLKQKIIRLEETIEELESDIRGMAEEEWQGW